MPTVTSSDGTSIAYDQAGAGPAVILVDGALCYRAFGPLGALATLLASHCTVITYDRRGRGESGDTAPYAVARTGLLKPRDPDTLYQWLAIYQQDGLAGLLAHQQGGLRRRHL